MSHLNFWTSSHCIKWIFEENEVKQREHKLAARWGLNKSQYDDLFSYLTKFIFLVCSDCGYDYHIAGIAAILFRRMYQKSSSLSDSNVLNDDPRLIAVCCIFITAKSKDCNISSINGFLGKIKKHHDPKFKYDQDTVLQSELLCLKVLSFDLNIFLPFEICSDLLMKCSALNLLPHVWKLLLDTFKSNIYLRYPPYLVAMGCIYIVCQQGHLDVDFEIFLRTFHIPLDNITEVSTFIIRHCYVKREGQQLQSKHAVQGKDTGSVPVDVLKAIDAFYEPKR